MTLMTPKEQAAALDLMVQEHFPHLVDTDHHRQTLEAIRDRLLTFDVETGMLSITPLGKLDYWTRREWVMRFGKI